MKILDANGFDPNRIKDMIAIDCDDVLDEMLELQGSVVPDRPVIRKFDPHNIPPLSEARRASMMKSLAEIPTPSSTSSISTRGSAIGRTERSEDSTKA